MKLYKNVTVKRSDIWFIWGKYIQFKPWKKVFWTILYPLINVSVIEDLQSQSDPGASPFVKPLTIHPSIPAPDDIYKKE